jgi:hypothetical protein
VVVGVVNILFAEVTNDGSLDLSFVLWLTWIGG